MIDEYEYEYEDRVELYEFSIGMDVDLELGGMPIAVADQLEAGRRPSTCSTRAASVQRGSGTGPNARLQSPGPEQLMSTLVRRSRVRRTAA